MFSHVRWASEPVQSRPMCATRRRAGILLGAIALSISGAACASHTAAPKPFPMPRPDTSSRPLAPPDLTPSGPVSSATVNQIIDAALSLRGTPYRNGGSDPRGFDCSGFTQYVFAQAGVSLPRDTREQFQRGTQVDAGQQQPGDLIFFHTVGDTVSHVGIALGDGRFVHAPSSRGVVRVESMDLPYWQRRFVGIRRMTN